MNDPFANVVVFDLPRPDALLRRYSKDDFSLRSGRDSISQLDTPPDTFSGGGIPAGGTADQVLAKVDGADFNVEWRKGMPTGGADGKVLGWVSGSPAWVDPVPGYSEETVNFYDEDCEPVEKTILVKD